MTSSVLELWPVLIILSDNKLVCRHDPLLFLLVLRKGSEPLMKTGKGKDKEACHLTYFKKKEIKKKNDDGRIYDIISF